MKTVYYIWAGICLSRVLNLSWYGQSSDQASDQFSFSYFRNYPLRVENHGSIYVGAFDPSVETVLFTNVIIRGDNTLLSISLPHSSPLPSPLPLHPSSRQSPSALHLSHTAFPPQISRTQSRPLLSSYLAVPTVPAGGKKKPGVIGREVGLAELESRSKKTVLSICLILRLNRYIWARHPQIQNKIRFLVAKLWKRQGRVRVRV